ncbi:MAG TPA: tetratricopeptide repeat protein [Steroidobacteraceae bacterium]|nr:tetratricopeptide repeat protein [Steroidobacteraceae bacterium]
MQFSPRGTGLAAALLGCCIVLAGCGGAEARRASHVERGQRYLAAGNLAKAQIEFRNALQIAPQSIEARLLIAQVDERLGNLAEATGLYESAIELQPDNVRARVGLGNLYALHGAPDRALATVRPALVGHPDDPDLLTVRGAALAAQQDRRAARADAERAVKVAPGNEDAVALLASLDVLDGRSEEAVNLLRATLARRPGSIDLRQVLASLYVRLDKPSEAAAQLAQIVAQSPKSLQYRYQLASLYARARRLDDADRVFRDAIAARPDDSGARLAYVEFLAQYRSSAAAERVLDAFIQREPADDALQLGLGALQLREGRAAQAIATYRSIAERDGEHPGALEARNRMAALLMQQGQWDQASDQIAAVLRVSPRNDDALLLRANVALDRGNPGAAIGDLRAVLHDQPRSAPVMRTLARAYRANGQAALAEETLRAAEDAAPLDVAVRLELAQLLTQTHRPDQALSLLEQTVARFPKNLTAEEALVRAYLARKSLAAAQAGAERLQAQAPALPVGFYLAGLIAGEQNRPEEAARELEHALKLRPDAVDALVVLTQVDLRAGRAQQALARAQSAAAAAPRNAAIQDLVGELLLSSKDYPRAIRQLTLATQLAPRWWLPYGRLASAEAASGDTAGAIRTYEQGIAAAGMQSVLATDLASLYEQQGRIDDAIREYEALQTHDPTLAANNLAMLLVTYRKDRASLDRAQHLVAGFAASENPQLLDTAGWVQLKLGDVQRALPELEKAADRAPHSSVIRYHLGMAEYQAGERNRARLELRSALSGSTSFIGSDEARSTLAALESHSG